ncbi:hypothetical protein BpHYR1_012332 [Brachionus plicatilis]|uniref:Uncharacterized protein n=1 Tax=Brachionus plicatilis TaxID=10195 RepID=A0A3M7RQM4_BRAPC|nr:hypothetical protein BpHYR1_012332 [Brachionus plicatilis]
MSIFLVASLYCLQLGHFHLDSPLMFSLLKNKLHKKLNFYTTTNHLIQEAIFNNVLLKKIKKSDFSNS